MFHPWIKGTRVVDDSFWEWRKKKANGKNEKKRLKIPEESLNANRR